MNESLIKKFIKVYENGKFKEELLSTSDEPTNTFKQSLISFGISNMNKDDTHFLNVVASTPSSIISVNYMDSMSMSSNGILVDGKITLENNKPIYLAARVGANENGLRSVGGANGEFPEGIEDAEQAFLFKVLLTDSENE